MRDLKVLLAPETNLPVDDQILVYNARTLSGGCGMGVVLGMLNWTVLNFQIRRLSKMQASLGIGIR